MHIVKKKKKTKSTEKLKIKSYYSFPTNSATVNSLICIVSEKNNIPFVYIRGIILCIFLADYLKHITSPLKRYSIYLVQKQTELQFYQY